MSRLPPKQAVTGAAALARTGFRSLSGRRIGLITNQTGLVDGRHLADLIHDAADLTLAAIFAPEHGFRGGVEAGAKVTDGRDPRTGVRVYSLYGATRKPTRAMLAGLDALVFDIQDIGVRFYTYISTMGLAMEAAAEAGLPFMVLDRPNPLGGIDVAGFTLEPKHRSFIGLYPMPIVHGMTVGELARMIKGEGWLAGLDRLVLEVIPVENWPRPMRWPETGLAWVPTSPNIPGFPNALVYPGIGMVGELLVNEGRGTPAPFLQFGTPWLNAPVLAEALGRERLPGITFEPTSYVPRSIPGVATDPRFRGEKVNSVKLTVTDADAYRPLETGIHVMAQLARAARKSGNPLFGKLAMFHASAGTERLYRLLRKQATGSQIVASWSDGVGRFRHLRRPYLLYT